jgi:lysophospholipase L1-like esterase
MHSDLPAPTGNYRRSVKALRTSCTNGYRLCVLLLGLLLPLLALPARAADPPAYAPLGPGDVYLALGDSLATGTEAAINDDGQPGYPETLLARLQQIRPGLKLENLARGAGETSSKIIAEGQLDQAVTFIEAERAAGRVVSPVTLTIGGNDMVAVIQPGSTTTISATLTLYASNLDTILDALLDALTDEQGRRTGDLIVATYYNPYPGLAAVSPLALSADPDRDIPRFNQIINTAAAARGIAVAEVYDAFPQEQRALGELIFVRFPYRFVPFEPELNFDFHPRPAGQRLIAATFADASGYTLPRTYLPSVVR